MKEKKITTEKGTVYYWISDHWNKERDTIFFFPGLTADHTLFDYQFAYFSKKYNLIAWDAPGHGKSRPYEEFSMEDATSLIMKILKENEINQILGVGQSFGGYFIQALMVRYPNVVKGFVGIGTTPYGEMYYSKSDIFWLKQVEWMGMCCPVNLLKKSAAKQATCTQSGYQNMIEMIMPYSKKEYCHLMQTSYDTFLKDNQNLDIKCPVLITHGEHDRTGKVTQYCKMWKEQTQYSLVIIKGAGHNANVDKAVEMNELMDKFFKEQCKVGN